MKELSSCRVLVTPRSFGTSDPNLSLTLEASVKEVIYNTTGGILSSADLIELLPGCDGYIAGVDSIDRQALEAAEGLKVISRYGVGLNNVDLQAAKELCITVTNTPAANAVSVAELTIGLIIALLRRIPAAVSETRSGKWPRMMGQAIENRTVAVIGLGTIGKQVVKRLSGFDCTILACDLYPDEAFVSKYGVQLGTMEDVTKQADILTLHIPLLPETVKLVDEEVIMSMKPGSFLINTSRGELLDENALLHGLNSGHLAGAALDVLSEEPPPTDHPLYKMANVLITPHTGAHTDSATNAMGWTALNDCLAVLSGKAPRHPVSG